MSFSRAVLVKEVLYFSLNTKVLMINIFLTRKSFLSRFKRTYVTWLNVFNHFNKNEKIKL